MSIACNIITDIDRMTFLNGLINTQIKDDSNNLDWDISDSTYRTRSTITIHWFNQGLSLRDAIDKAILSQAKKVGL